MIEHPFWLEGGFDKGKAFWDLVAMANWRDTTERVGRETFTVKRGEVCISVNALSRRWGWSRARIYRFFARTASEHMATHRTIHPSGVATSVISITNYDRYQSPDTSNDTGVDTPTDTPPTPKPRDSNDLQAPKKGKKDKNNINYGGKFLKFWSAYPPRKGMRRGKAECWALWQTHNYDDMFDEIMHGLNALRQTEQWKKSNGEFILMPQTFLNFKARRWEVEKVSQSQFLNDMLDVKRQEVLKKILEEVRPDLLVNFDDYCSGKKPIPPKYNAYMEEDYHNAK